MPYPEFTIRNIREEQLIELAKFVVEQNMIHHIQDSLTSTNNLEVDMVYKEERSFFSQSIYAVAYDIYNEIVGSIRTMECRGNEILPLEKIYKIDIDDFIDKELKPTIYHIGRFAVKKGYSNIELFKTMILSAIEPICQNPNGVAFAECDIRLMRTLKKMGIDTEIIAKPVVYLGSTTVAIRMSGKTLSNFYFQNFKPIQDNSNGFLKMVI